MERFASPYDGEKLAALNLAQKMLADRGLRWGDILGESAVVVAGGQGAAPPPVRGWRDVAADLLTGAPVNDWERGFLESLIFKGGRFSDKRQNKLMEMCHCYGVRPWTVAP